MGSNRLKPREEIDALGRQPERITAFTGQLLEGEEDQVLQQIVQEASKDLSTPMALVNFVLERVQFFKAHHGLPEDLAAARGTDRNVSFCQFVVRDGVPFEVEDAETDHRVPKHLVKPYSIRSYLGMPIKANDVTIGSLCVIDTKPRKFSTEEKDKLSRLAKRVNKRLSILAENRRQPDTLRSQQNMGGAVEELENALHPISEDIMVGRSSNQALGAFLRLIDFDNSPSSPFTVDKDVIKQTMKAASEALVDAGDRLFAIDVSLNRAQGLVDMLRSQLRQEVGCSVSGVVRESIELTKDLLLTTGGVSFTTPEQDDQLIMPRSSAVLLCSTALSSIATAKLKAQLDSKMEVKIDSNKGVPEVTISVALPQQQRSAICRKLNEQSVEYSLAATAVSDEKQLCIRFGQ